jgi:HEAT repeat protein
MDILDKLNRLKSSIKSGNPELIEHALEEIKNKGDDTYIAPLIEFLHQTTNKDVREKVYGLFTDLKHENSVDIFVNVMKNENDLDVLERLVAACWQNGLNYSKHLPYFVQLIIDQEFQIAFEAFTVIENMYGKIEDDIEAMLLGKIEKSITIADEKKQYLLKGLLEIIPHIPIDQDPVDF